MSRPIGIRAPEARPARQDSRHSLVDRFHLWVFPVLIGSGKRLFAEGTVPAGLKLVDSRHPRPAR